MREREVQKLHPKRKSSFFKLEEEEVKSQSSAGLMRANQFKEESEQEDVLINHQKRDSISPTLLPVHERHGSTDLLPMQRTKSKRISITKKSDINFDDMQSCKISGLDSDFHDPIDNDKDEER